MKWLVVVPDGAADNEINLVEGSPLEKASTEALDNLARKGHVGLVKTIPKGLPPGSDIGNMSLLGFEPEKFWTGRAPLEALGAGIELKAGYTAFRMNFVSLKKPASERLEEYQMDDYGVEDVSDQEGMELINLLKEAFEKEDLIKAYGLSLHKGMSFKHILLAKGDYSMIDLPSAHTFIGKTLGQVGPFNNRGNSMEADESTKILRDIVRISIDVFANSHINKKRLERGLKPVDSVWLWGQGTAMKPQDFYKLRKLKSGLISGVNIVKGIGLWANMDVPDVNGATGTIDTNYTAKVQKIIEGFESGKDIMFCHIEAPDDCSHRSDLHGKVRSIELIDQLVISPLLDYLKKDEEFAILVAPDHYTYLKDGSHGEKAVPYLIYYHGAKIDNTYKEIKKTTFREFSEKEAVKGSYFSCGKDLMDCFLSEDKVKALVNL